MDFEPNGTSDTLPPYPESQSDLAEIIADATDLLERLPRLHTWDDCVSIAGTSCSRLMTVRADLAMRRTMVRCAVLRDDTAATRRPRTVNWARMHDSQRCDDETLDAAERSGRSWQLYRLYAHVFRPAVCGASSRTPA
jgi:hypothetical protein